MRVIGIFNRDGGIFRGLDLEAFSAETADTLMQAGHTFSARIVSEDELEAALEQEAASAEAADVLMVGGGDGTISLAAGVAFRHGVALAPLPGGTMNLFSRSLGLPLDPAEAVRAIAAGHIESIDIASANGRPFVVLYSVGLHPRLVRLRNAFEYHSRIGKLLATVRALFSAVARPLRFRVELSLEGTRQRVRAGALVVSNNRLAEGHVPHAEVLDEGVLGLYLASPMPVLATIGFVGTVILGRWRRHPGLTEMTAKSLALDFPRPKPGAHAVIDGELIALEKHVELRIHPKALKVVRPGPMEQVSETT